jgi:transposase
MSNNIEIPLDLPEVRVLDVSQSPKAGWLIRVESLVNGTSCHQCGQWITDFHGLAKPLRLRHLPLFEVPVWIELCPKRYRCLDCDKGPTTTQPPDWYERRSSQTKALSDAEKSGRA